MADVRKKAPHDGNSAVAHVAHATNEVIAIYPITPSSPMGEISDEKSARGEKNIWGTVPSVSELQSEGGAAGAIHGALATGSMATTFTASQGLLLMIPNMYKIAGELTSTVFHVSARALAMQGLNIFGDHSDVMACRQTGWAMLASASVQEAMDFALIAQASTLECRIPFLHFFDGFRVSHEVQKIEELTFDDMKAMIDNDLVRAHRQRGLSPDRPMIAGTSQNPDVYFTGRETVNKYYHVLPSIVQKQMDKFAKIVGRQYKLYEYVGAKDAEKVIVIMGSGCETVQEVVEHLTAKGEKIGLLKVRLFHPIDEKAFVEALPSTVKKIAVLDRTKEPGSLGEPLYMATRTAIDEARETGVAKLSANPRIVGGRYGLGSAEFTPGMVKAVYDNLDKNEPKNHFTIGINDDVCGTSLEFDANFTTEGNETYRAIFYGLGSDGTVGANKNTIKIIADKTDQFAQGYFEYDSKKAGTLTSSHLRFGPSQIRAPYLITKAKFIACHNFSFLPKYDMLKNAIEGATFLLTSEYPADEVWKHIPGRVQKQIIDKKLKFYVIDAIKIAEQLGLGARINTIMQAAFFKISQVMDEKLAVDSIKYAIQKSYGNKGEKIVKMNNDAVDAGLTQIHEVKYSSVTNPVEDIASVPSSAPNFVKEVTQKLLRQEGTTVKVSQMPADGKWITGTTQYEKRNIAVEVPVWDNAPKACSQCNNCVFVCPHAAIRPKVYDASCLNGAPKTFKSTDALGKEFEGKKYTLQVAIEDCTGCGLCVEICPLKEKNAPLKMEHQLPLHEQEVENYDFFLNKLPDVDATTLKLDTVKGSQFVKPLFEYSGACAGCGETGYVKLLSQLFGDRLVIGNATGCSSIYGGNLPTTPFTKRADGRGPTWCNSLFEDNAEFAYGMRLTADKFNERAKEMAAVVIANDKADGELKSLLKSIVDAPQKTQVEIEAVRANVEKVKKILEQKGCCGDKNSDCTKELLSIADYFVKKSIWAVGGDGWAYDIGFGGLDHVIASGKNVNLLVMDTEVYSNTGGQASKATPKGAVAKFAAGGKPVGKKDLGAIGYSYGYVYVARVSLANPSQVVKAMLEAEAYDGPSLIIAYSHCVAHGITMSNGVSQAKKAIETGHVVLYRYNPENTLQGKNPLTIDSKEPTLPLSDFTATENRFRILQKANPKAYEKLIASADAENRARIATLKHLASE
ncbi:MAG: pyruvate:ferredoxin (flavodoxin) oxidoreductase [Chitinivibrionia bacterium]|nr:pyruvate:ferredoxin (flavodoxin) oxidoreductase [Chitinivibrionia bacterium]